MSFIFDIFGLWKKTYMVNSNHVMEKPSEDYKNYVLLNKENTILLYEIVGQNKFEIVLKKELINNTVISYSLFRTENKSNAEIMYALCKEVIPLLVNTSPQYITREKLQELVDMIRSKPTWSMAHFAAHFGMVDCFQNQIIKEFINEQASDTLVTPLMIAIKNKQISVVIALIAHGVDMNALDASGDTIYHYAANSNKEIIRALNQTTNVPSINKENYEGYTALHMACLADKPECVTELLRGKANVNISASKERLHQNICYPNCEVKEILALYPNQLHSYDMKNGGTPLHWVKSTECLEALIESGCNLDARNFQGDTALHIMISKSKMSCVIMLLSHGAQVNIQGSEDNTPLHLAVKSEDISIVQALLTFGADVNMKNADQQTPRHIAAYASNQNLQSLLQNEMILYALHAVGAKRCRTDIGDCSNGCSRTGTYNGVSPETPYTFQNNSDFHDILATLSMTKEKSSNDPQKSYRLLTLDGGGIRGLIMIQMLSYIETMLPKPIHTYFDWIAGTSTGALCALALAQGRTTMQIRCTYLRFKNKVFVGSRPYNTENLENFLKKEFGATTKMIDLKGPKIIITGALADRHPAELHLFRNYHSPRKILCLESGNPKFPPIESPEDQLVWLAAHASGAAPTYFQSPGRFFDGGLIANNPTLDALTEIHQYNAALKFTNRHSEIERLGLVVSLGTGRVPIVPVTAIDTLRLDSLWGYAKVVIGASTLGQIILDQITQSDGHIVERAQAWCDSCDIPFVRLNPPLYENIVLDETDNRILMKMCWETLAFMHSKQDEIKKLVKLLKTEKV